MRSSTKKRRGRPRAFDEAHALDRMAEVFWSRGFSATSLDAIAAATGVARPSLYATFGDKQSMYLRAMTSYAARIAAALAQARDQDLPLRAKLTGIYAVLIDVYTSTEQDHTAPRGCMVVCTAPAEAAERAEVRQALQSVIDSIDAGMHALLQAADAHELAANLDTEDAALVLSSTVHSLSVRARSGAPRATLERLAHAAITAVCAP